MDRCLPFYFDNLFKGKKVALICVGNFREYLEFDGGGKSKWADDEQRSVERCLTALENFANIFEMNIVGKVSATQSNPEVKKGELVGLGSAIKG